MGNGELILNKQIYVTLGDYFFEEQEDGTLYVGGLCDSDALLSNYCDCEMEDNLNRRRKNREGRAMLMLFSDELLTEECKRRGFTMRNTKIGKKRETFDPNKILRDLTTSELEDEIQRREQLIKKIQREVGI